VRGLIRHELKGIVAALADLKERVRVALAGEIAGAVAGAVREVVRATVAGDIDPDRVFHGTVRRGWTDDGSRSWSDDDDDSPYGRAGRSAVPPVATAVAAGVCVARWWISRNGTPAGAAGIGLAVGVVGLAGGSVALAFIAALAAVADLLAVTETLGTGAECLDQL
jgi:hypothetical protein